MVKNPLELCLFYKPSKNSLHTLTVSDVYFDDKQFLRAMPVLYTLKEKIAHFVSKKITYSIVWHIVTLNEWSWSLITNVERFICLLNVFSRHCFYVLWFICFDAKKSLVNSVNNDTISVSLLLVRFSGKVVVKLYHSYNTTMLSECFSGF